MNLLAIIAWLFLANTATVNIRNGTTSRVTAYAVCGLPQRLGDVESLSSESFTTRACSEFRVMLRFHPSRKVMHGERLYVLDGDVVSVDLTNVGAFYWVRRP